jgi:hypothetical protein
MERMIVVPVQAATSWHERSSDAGRCLAREIAEIEQQVKRLNIKIE